MSARYAGKLSAKRASGTLDATITVVDASGTTVTTCRTGSVRWSATRAPGRVYAGSTAQDHPDRGAGGREAPEGGRPDVRLAVRHLQAR